MDVVIRPAVAADAAAVTALVRQAYAPYVERIGGRPAPMDDDYAARIAGGEVWVAEADGVPAGIVVLVLAPDHLLLDNIAVSAAVRGGGVGARLLAFTEEQAREAGRSEIRLYTNAAMTENIGYYARRGFTETHRAVDQGFHRVFFVKRLPAR
jgi:N-acetylglutamate synthase-like GNAT family acetyltransferase